MSGCRQESRRQSEQNKFFISINCSKAIDPYKLETLTKLIEETKEKKKKVPWKAEESSRNKPLISHVK